MCNMMTRYDTDPWTPTSSSVGSGPSVAWVRDGVALAASSIIHFSMCLLLYCVLLASEKAPLYIAILLFLMAMSHCACIVRDAYVRGLPPPVRNLCCRMCRPCKTRCVDLPSCALTGPILRSIECCVLPARRVGRKRTLRARRRGLYAMWCSALYWRVWSGVDLSGGALGARVTNRKRVEQNTFQMLSAQVHALAQQLEQFKSRKPRNPRARPRRKVQASRPSPAVVSSPSGVASPDGALYNQLLSLFQSWKSPNPPSDAQVRAALMGVLSPGPSQSPEAVKPQKPQSAKPQSEKPPSWAHLFAGPSNAPDPKPPRRSLYGPAWSAKVIQFAQLKDHALDADLVISRASDEEAKSKDWLLAHGYKHKATLVIYDADETDTTVLFNSNAGPVPAKAKVVELQPSGPSRKALPAALKDDKAHDVDKTPTCFMRLTLSRNFAAPSLFSQVKQRPQCLPAVDGHHRRDLPTPSATKPGNTGRDAKARILPSVLLRLRPSTWLAGSRHRTHVRNSTLLNCTKSGKRSSCVSILTLNLRFASLSTTSHSTTLLAPSTRAAAVVPQSHLPSCAGIHARNGLKA